METSIVKAERQELTPGTWDMIQNVAPVLYQAGLFGVGSTQQATAIMLKGYELGLQLAASFEFIHVIQGKPTLSPKGALALIMADPSFVSMDVVDETDKRGNPASCTVTMTRNNGMTYTASFSMADAERAEITDRKTWAKYPGNMLRWRAIGYVADVVFPDVIGGLKRADEMGADITPEGDVVEGQWQVSRPRQKTENEQVTERLKLLIDTYGVAAVNGTMPNEFTLTLEATQTLATLLAQECECFKLRGEHENGILCHEDICQYCLKGRGVHVKGVLCTEKEGV